VRHARLFTLAGAAATGLALGGCLSDTAAPTDQAVRPTFSRVSGSTDSYLILGKGNKLPKDLAGKVKMAGGTLTATATGIGVAVATASGADFQTRASTISGVEAVAPDQMVQWIDPTERVREAGEATPRTDIEGARGASLGDDEAFFNAQWAPKAIHAPQAWDAGARGNGVRVAVIDGGLNADHVDLAGSVDVARSKSFVPGFAFNQDVPCTPTPPDTTCLTFSHATHVAGIIAARDNQIGTIGVAPGATIIGVKVLHGGTGPFGAVIQGIVYAATPISQGGAGADIINMSLGASFERQGRNAAHLANAVSRATTYANQQGVTVIASAGNEATDFDHTNNLIAIPAQSTHVLAVSATGPVGFALGATNFDRPASYTNFGQSAIDFGAPGGDFVLPGEAECSVPRIPMGVLVNFCWVFDMVLSPASLVDQSNVPVNNRYFFSAGTSMAAPHVSGVAALIIERNGGSMNPAQVQATLRASADDLGKPGNDDFYGRGRVNALSAVQ
jgi:subtilisin family serine protease